MKESFAENQKHQRVAKPVCSINTNTVKMQVLHSIIYSNCQYEVFVWILVSESLDSMLLKLCELILPCVRFAGLHDFTNFITEEKNSQQYVVLYTKISYTLVF